MSAVIRLAAVVVRGVCDDDGDDAEAMRELALDARREHDAAIAERDRLIREKNKWRKSCLGAEQECDRLRRELETLRDECAESPAWWDHAPLADRIDAILRGES